MTDEIENAFLRKCLEDELESGNRRMKLMRDTGRLEGWIFGMIAGMLIGWLCIPSISFAEEPRYVCTAKNKVTIQSHETTCDPKRDVEAVLKYYIRAAYQESVKRGDITPSQARREEMRERKSYQCGWE